MASSILKISIYEPVFPLLTHYITLEKIGTWTVNTVLFTVV